MLVNVTGKDSRGVGLLVWMVQESVEWVVQPSCGGGNRGGGVVVRWGVVVHAGCI